MSFIFCLAFLKNLMTYLIYQGDLICSAMHKPKSLTVFYGSILLYFLFLFFPPPVFYHKQEKIVQEMDYILSGC